MCVWPWRLDWTIADYTSWQLGNAGPWNGTSEMTLVANTKGTSQLSFAEDEDTFV